MAQKLRPEPDSSRAKEIDAWIKEFHIFRLTVTYKEKGCQPKLILKFPTDTHFGSDLALFKVKEKPSFPFKRTSVSSDSGHQQYPASARVWELSDANTSSSAAPTRAWGSKSTEANGSATEGTKLGRYSLSENNTDYSGKPTQSSSTLPISPATTVVNFDSYTVPSTSATLVGDSSVNASWPTLKFKEEPEESSPRYPSLSADKVRDYHLKPSNTHISPKQKWNRWSTDKDKDRNFDTPRTSSKRPRSRSSSPSPSRTRRFSNSTHKSEHPPTPTRPRLMQGDYRKDSEYEKVSSRTRQDEPTRRSKSRSISEYKTEGARFPFKSRSRLESTGADPSSSGRTSSPSSAALARSSSLGSFVHTSSRSPMTTLQSAVASLTGNTGGVGNSASSVPSSADINSLLSSLRSSSSLSSSTATAVAGSGAGASSAAGLANSLIDSGATSSLPISAASLSMILSELPSLAATLQSQLSTHVQAQTQPSAVAIVESSSSTPAAAVNPTPVPPPGTTGPLQMNYDGQYGPYTSYAFGGYPAYAAPYPHTYSYVQPTVAAANAARALAEEAPSEAKPTITPLESVSMNIKVEPTDTNMDQIPNPVSSGKSPVSKSVSTSEREQNGTGFVSRIIRLRSELLELREEIRERAERQKGVLSELQELTEKRKTDFVLGEVDSSELDGLDDVGMGLGPGLAGLGLGPGEDEAMMPSSSDVETELRTNLLILQAQLENERTSRRKADQDRRDAEYAKRQVEHLLLEAEQGRTEAQRVLKEVSQAHRDADIANKESERLRREAEQGLREAVERRREAEQSRRDAEYAKREADERRKDAEHAKREAEDRRREAEHARRDAEHAKRKVEYTSRDADDRRRAAEQAKREAELAKREFEQRLKVAENARREADERRWAAEAIVEDVKRECREPFVVPALMDAFLNVQRLTSQTNPTSVSAAVPSTRQE
ncbi:hypothetical protein BT96DRAFT_554955 [Gymnopus androsaceus JB14]|uniref:Uncharacterized protein n=1 Tax=Gymnopus androsaceus JB14 TaxID=1447944 RepID=A0A6A4HVE8_9AGAR|nr:hypothetical protein BT96DRAFT_554955 [Gymnopus androsaceus JB14]